MSDKKVLIDESEGTPNQFAPPPYGYNPQYDQNNDQKIKVVDAQPGMTPVNAVYYTPPSDNFFLLSIFLTVFCCVCGSWIAMCCTIPAIIFAVHARDAESRGDVIGMKKKRTAALVFNIVGFVCGLLLTIATWAWMYLYYTGAIREYYGEGEGHEGEGHEGEGEGHDFDHDGD